MTIKLFDYSGTIVAAIQVDSLPDVVLYEERAFLPLEEGDWDRYYEAKILRVEKGGICA